MPKLVYLTWVKNVNKQRIVSGVRGVYISPINNSSVHVNTQPVEKVLFTHQPFPPQSIWFSTPINVFLYLLNKLYTHNPQSLLLSPIKRI